MIRWSVLISGVAVVIGAAFVTGKSIPPKAEDGLAKPDEVKGAVLGHKMAFFNLPKVLKNYKRSGGMAAQLNAQRFNLSIRLVEWKGRYAKLQSDIAVEQDADAKEKMAAEMVQLTRKIEDKEREISKALSERSAEIIVALYDDIREVSVEVARERGLVVLFAYPDVSHPEEMELPQVKELKLKPPAVMPFYLDPSVDYTDELLQRLNAKFAANDGK